jgi:hypothetical protein
MYQGNHLLVERLVQLKLNIVHKMILEWFFDYSSTKQMLELKIKDHPDIPFYWVYFPKLKDDLPLLPDNSNYKINKYMNELCGDGQPNENKYPLIKKVFPTKDGNKVGFAIRPEIYLWLKGDNNVIEGLIPDLNIEKKHKRNRQQKYVLKDTTKELIEVLSKIKKSDGTNLFNMIMPEDDYHYTQGIKRFQWYLLELYKGHFLENEIGQLDKRFTGKYSYYISNKNIKLIKECKDDWKKIGQVIIEAANRYIKWFKSTNEVIDKDKLPKNIADFIFNPQFGSSMFYICLDKSPTLAKEVIAESIYNKTPNLYKNYFEELYNTEWDGLAYWNRIYSIHTWYRDNADDLIAENINYKYWLEDEDKFAHSYFDFINSHLETKHLAHFGTKCKTWKWFMDEMKEQHGIEE